MYPSTREGRQEDPKLRPARATQWHVIKIIMIITQNSNSDLILHFEGILRSFIISLILEPITLCMYTLVMSCYRKHSG